MKLYELTKDYVSAIEKYNQVETDEDLILVEQHLNSIAVPFKEKCVALAHHILNVEGEQSAIETEIERLSKHLDRNKRQAEFFKRYLKGAMEQTGETKIETPTVKLSFRKSESVEVEDETRVPDT